MRKVAGVVLPVHRTSSFEDKELFHGFGNVDNVLFNVQMGFKTRACVVSRQLNVFMD